MASSHSFGNTVSRFELSVEGATSYAKELPKEAAAHAKGLAKIATDMKKLNAAQEKTKQQLAQQTAQLETLAKDGTVLRGKIVRLAEATFGPRSPELKEFRPATEGKVAKARTKKKTPA